MNKTRIEDFLEHKTGADKHIFTHVYAEISLFHPHFKATTQEINKKLGMEYEQLHKALVELTDANVIKDKKVDHEIRYYPKIHSEPHTYLGKSQRAIHLPEVPTKRLITQTQAPIKAAIHADTQQLEKHIKKDIAAFNKEMQKYRDADITVQYRLNNTEYSSTNKEEILDDFTRTKNIKFLLADSNHPFATIRPRENIISSKQHWDITAINPNYNTTENMEKRIEDMNLYKQFTTAMDIEQTRFKFLVLK